MLVQIGIHYARLRHGFIVSAPHRTRARQRCGYPKIFTIRDLQCSRILKFVLIGLEQFRLYLVVSVLLYIGYVPRPRCETRTDSSCINCIAQQRREYSDLINDRRRTVLILDKADAHVSQRIVREISIESLSISERKALSVFFNAFAIARNRYHYVKTS